MAFQEGGVGWACNLYADLVGHWKKRNARALAEVDPANLDRKRLAELFGRYADPAWRQKLSQWKLDEEGGLPAMPGAGRYDDFAACGIERAEDIRELFCKNFHFGCEADDPMNAWGCNSRVNPYGARLKTLFGSDIGHFDVPDMREVLPEAHELVDEGLIEERRFPRFRVHQPGRVLGWDEPGFLQGHARRKSGGGRPGGGGQKARRAARREIAVHSSGPAMLRAPFLMAHSSHEPESETIVGNLLGVHIHCSRIGPRCGDFLCYNSSNALSRARHCIDARP